MGGFDLEQPALPAARAETDRVHAALEGALGDVSQQVGALLDGGWTGPAASSYRTAFDQWRAGAEEVLRALTTMSQLLGATADDYASSDARSTDQMQRLQGRLG